MNVFRLFFRFFRWRPWMKIPAMILGVIGVVVGIWFGFPLLGHGIIASVWLRVTLIGLILGTIAIVQLVKWRHRRRAAREIEEALTPAEADGDGKVLAERMQGALATLKKSGGASYLYDLPWYVIIGPPGAGKTTALRNSGIEFPLSAADDAGVVTGFGGTRYCDWWFAEDAILIDTAGRYTTQDSDRTADESSWQAFLDLLKKSRPNQPINGVILAFSVEDMMQATEDDLARHAEIVRARLGEVHEKLRIDFPVYVLFTKADLIAGFREYFSSFSLSRRKAVWGVTFQTKDRKAQTHEQVPAEFDKLVSRLSDEIIDRLTEEPDGISRIAIFGLPGQMALMRDNVADFLRRVFEPTRYKSSAILRGFYFTSGTQEGTPIDQVLGAMARNDQAPGAFAPAFMSGQGKSFFLHDLLRRVIFEERDWVSHDARAVRRTQILRGLGFSVLGLGTAAALAAFGYSYWLNRNLVQETAQEAQNYEIQAQREIERTEIDDTDVAAILPYLERIRMMPAGYGFTTEPTMLEGFGLGQRDRIAVAATDAYADALEQMLRPRLILDVENRLPQLRAAGEPAEIYRALKVYMLLAGQGGRVDDAAIMSFFDGIWRAEFGGLNGLNQREQLNAHLEAMLSLDDTRDISVPIDDNAVTLARSAIVRMSLADQAYAIISDRAVSSGLQPLRLVDVAGPETGLVFETLDGSDLATVAVPGLYTYEGYWGFFFEELSRVAQVLEDDKWVLGEQAEAVDFDAQLAGLDQALQLRYGRDFEAAWQTMFDQFRLTNMSADKPRYDILGIASSSVASPILQLVKAVEAETRLTREFEALAGLDAAALTSGDVADDVGGQLASRFRSRSSGVQRILLDALSNGNKNQNRVNGSADSPTRAVERLEGQFSNWHVLLEGQPGQRPIDIVLADLAAIRDNFRIAEANPTASAALLPQLLSNLTRNNSRLPPKLREMINDAERDFRSEATDATLAEMNRALNNDVAFTCREGIAGAFPFASTQRQVPMGVFANFFGPGGDMDKFYNTYLAGHVIRGDDGLEMDPASPLAGRISPNALRQFDRAQKIKSAFFGAGGATPEVPILIGLASASPSVREVELTINGVKTTTRVGAPAQTVIWRGDGSATVLLVFADFGGGKGPQYAGPWAIMKFIQEGSSRGSGNNIEVTHQVEGRSVTVNLSFSAVTNPFTMPELRDFTCPTSLD